MSEGLLATDTTEPTDAGGLPPSGFSYSAAVKDDGAFEPGWHEHLDGDYAAAAKTVANYKTLPELAKGLYEARKALSQRDERVAVPGADATPEQIQKYREALGIPEKVEDYKIGKPEDVPDELWDENAANTYREVFHKLNIPPKAANELINTYIEIERGRQEAMVAHQQGELERARKELQSEFGSEMTKQLDLARRLAITAGVNPNDPAFNSPAVVKALAFAGRNMGEDRMVSSEDSGGLNSSMARAKDIAQNPNNPMHQKYLSGDPDTVAYVTRLIQGKV
ncbi:MAG: hypothetical protein ACO3LT_08185 [Ilumatobacteraceae bacterium]